MAKPIAQPLPDRIRSDEPEIEVLRGIELPKVSPKRRHARLQLVLGALLSEWAGTSGEVGSEWRFRLSRKGGVGETTLVPDLAFVRTERMAPLADDEAEEPPFAPDVAIEIRSQGDRDHNIHTKLTLYLAAGSRLVLDVDPSERRIVAHDHAGQRTFQESAKFEHPKMPGFSFGLADVFAQAERKR